VLHSFLCSPGLTAQTQTWSAIEFTNIAGSAGIKFVHFKGNEVSSSTARNLVPGVCVADFDGDGWQDIYFVNGHDLHKRGIAVRNAVYRNNGDGTFTDVTDRAGVPGSGYGLSCVWGDYDNDGSPDLCGCGQQWNAPLLLHNSGGNGNHFLNFRMVGKKSNRDAMGAIGIVAACISQFREVEGGGGSYLSQSNGGAKFGLGKATRADHVEIKWPSGLQQTYRHVAPTSSISLRKDRIGWILKPSLDGQRQTVKS
jgi:hypothetical protein